MSIQRIDNPFNNTRGWQARAHVAPGQRITRFFADKAHGGPVAAQRAAEVAEASLKRQVKRARRAAG